MKRLQHRLAHKFGLYTGNVVSWWGSDDGYLYIGFQCSTCGEINGGHRSAQGIKRSGLDINNPAHHAAIGMRYALSALKTEKE